MAAATVSAPLRSSSSSLFLASRLLGPPESRSLLNSSPKPSPSDFTADSDFDLHRPSSSYGSPPTMGRTENRSPTYLSSSNPCLDFFFQIVPDTPCSKTVSLLSSAWSHDPLTALKLVFNLRGIRGTGKGDRHNFHASALWLHRHHPQTLAANVQHIAEFGYMKDLLFILQHLVHGPRDPKDLIRTYDKRVNRKLSSDLRHKKRAERGLKAIQRYAEDPLFRYLHDRVADFFAAELLRDLDNLTRGRLNRIGLAAKWCPSLYSSFDERTCICESIARRIFPKDSEPVYVKIDEEYYAYRARQRLRKDVLVPLRKVLELPEVYMSQNLWSLLPYNRVPSVAMKNYTPLFVKHDDARFKAYLESVKKGSAKIAAGALLPHQILSSVCYHGYYSDGDDDGAEVEVAELQWKRMVQDLAANGALSNCIAVCDVSGSMMGTPMEVCIALGILLSELSEDPWRGRVITFSERPEIHKVEGETLREKARFVEEMKWGYNTDFQKVFDKILEIAVDGNLKAEEMVRRVFVFSDMEFDQASSNDWETDYEAICRKYGEKGYGGCVPEIVFWNLRDSKSTPVLDKQEGVAMVSGFSKNLMKLFLNGEEERFSPAFIMEKAISGSEYHQLVLVD